MIFLALKPLSLLLLIGITFVASFDLDQQAGELFASFGGIAEPNKDLASEPQQKEGNNGLELIASNNPTHTTGEEYSEFPIFQSGNHKCPYNLNQPYSRRARLKRGEVCVPSRDDHGQAVQDSVQAEPEEENPQENAQPDDSPVYQKPLAPYKDKLLCPIPVAPWPVCGTVDSFYSHHQIIYPVMNAPMGWWIHEYCVPGVYLYSPRLVLCDYISLRRKQVLRESRLLTLLRLSAPRFPNVCNKLAREVVWCCGAVFSVKIPT